MISDTEFSKNINLLLEYIFWNEISKIYIIFSKMNCFGILMYFKKKIPKHMKYILKNAFQMIFFFFFLHFLSSFLVLFFHTSSSTPAGI